MVKKKGGAMLKPAAVKKNTLMIDLLSPMKLRHFDDFCLKEMEFLSKLVVATRRLTTKNSKLDRKFGFWFDAS